MQKILVFKNPAKLVLEAEGKEDRRGEKSFKTRVTSSNQSYISQVIYTLKRTLLVHQVVIKS